MADDITRAVCSAYKEIQKSGVANVRNRSELRKVIPKNEEQMRQQEEARRAWYEDIMGQDFEKIQENTRKSTGKAKEKETKLPESIMDEYLKGFR